MSNLRWSSSNYWLLYFSHSFIHLPIRSMVDICELPSGSWRERDSWKVQLRCFPNAILFLETSCPLTDQMKWIRERKWWGDAAAQWGAGAGGEEEEEAMLSRDTHVCSRTDLSHTEYQGLICHNKISMSTATEAWADPQVSN